jgi:hypothetical protein
MANNKKDRESLSKEIAARVLFLADRTCCVCRGEGKPVQIHHIDENPANNEFRNLAVLCFDCHRETQIWGGFDRKLDADQVMLYRDDWNRIVARTRATDEVAMKQNPTGGYDIEQITSIAEAYRENGEFELLASHYDMIGNNELRDKYIDIALSKAPSDDTVLFLRGLQSRTDLIPVDVINREDARLIASKDWLQRARMLKKLSRHPEAVHDYLQGILNSLSEDQVFSAAYYLKELSEAHLFEELFVIALKKAQAASDLWWQIRALQELGWHSELNDLLLKNESEIMNSDDLILKRELALVKGDQKAWLDLGIKIAKIERMSSDLLEEDEADVANAPDDQKKSQD